MGADPRAGVAEDGMLALATADRARAGAFRRRLLDEASREIFSRRGETKYWQFEASLRAYYYPRVRDAFPGLFSPEDERRVAAWFAAINRRALSPGLDDAIYALAFRKAPEGPYENQENGAGLLALLEAGGLAAPELAARNRAYLDRVPRGWEARFRNNDDSYGYQPEWIDNAYYRSLRSGRLPFDAARRSFEWLLLQAEPGGRPPDYNAAVPPMLPGSAYLGALLTRDPTLLWLAGRSVRAFERAGLALPAQPGAERALDATGVSPTAGSCLLFADSGLPNRVGPLAPDKVVLRDGWSESSLYLLLNLRFSGWHRYRATNAIVRVVARRRDARRGARRRRQSPSAARAAALPRQADSAREPERAPRRADGLRRGGLMRSPDSAARGPRIRRISRTSSRSRPEATRTRARRPSRAGAAGRTAAARRSLPADRSSSWTTPQGPPAAGPPSRGICAAFPRETAIASAPRERPSSSSCPWTIRAAPSRSRPRRRSDWTSSTARPLPGARASRASF